MITRISSVTPTGFAAPQDQLVSGRKSQDKTAYMQYQMTNVFISSVSAGGKFHDFTIKKTTDKASPLFF